MRIRDIADVDYFLGIELIKKYNRKQDEIEEYYREIDIPAEVYTGRTIEELAYKQIHYSERLEAIEALLKELRNYPHPELWLEVLKEKAEVWAEYQPINNDWYKYEAVMEVLNHIKNQA